MKVVVIARGEPQIKQQGLLLAALADGRTPAFGFPENNSDDVLLFESPSDKDLVWLPDSESLAFLGNIRVSCSRFTPITSA